MSVIRCASLLILLSQAGVVLPALASDKLADLVRESARISLVQVLGGEVSRDGLRSYVVEFERDIYAAAGTKMKQDRFSCACNLKVGSSYIAFVYDPDGEPYIRAAYEVLSGQDVEARRVASGEPIVLVDDTSSVNPWPLLLSRELPTSYESNVFANGANHTFFLNSWYRLRDVETSIRGFEGSMDATDKKKGQVHLTEGG